MNYPRGARFVIEFPVAEQHVQVAQAKVAQHPTPDI
jgi:hypothetical protein